MVDVPCPAGDCDYSAPPSSVEGHISGSTRGWHSGKQGRQYRELLTERAESVAEGAMSPDGAGDDTSEEAGEEPSEAGEDAESGAIGPTTSAAALGIATGSSMLGSGGSDLPLAKIGIAVAVVLVAYLVFSAPTSAEGEADVAPTDDQEETGAGLASA